MMRAQRQLTIIALRAKRMLVVQAWAPEAQLLIESGDFASYLRASERMMRLTSAIDHALVRLGAEV